jgi:hypothetical protein
MGYEKMKIITKEIFGYNINDDLPTRLVIICSMFGAMLSSIITNPFDVIKTRIQVNDPNKIPYNGIFKSFSRIVKEEGFKSLYLGYKPRLLWLSLQGTFSMVIYEKMKILLR